MSLPQLPKLLGLPAPPTSCPKLSRLSRLQLRALLGDVCITKQAIQVSDTLKLPATTSC